MSANAFALASESSRSEQAVRGAAIEG
eukprot:SAG31_NODE_41332_length_276_cov_1.169492_1_plen_26_part_10